jgi:hypothetical protein
MNEWMNNIQCYLSCLTLSEIIDPFSVHQLIYPYLLFDVTTEVTRVIGGRGLILQMRIERLSKNE